MTLDERSILLSGLEALVIEAGQEALRYYGKPHDGVQVKADDSPLTLADQAVHHFIMDALGRLTPDIPVLSEESSAADYADRQAWARFWLVDPLDGTKEFLKQSGEFTVNVALVEGQSPVLGVVYAPVLETMWSGGEHLGAFKTKQGQRRAITTRPADPNALVVVASRDHAGPRIAHMKEAHPSIQFTSMGSSLKFCLVAEGQADLYPRLSPTMEWDTCAAQAVVEAAGGQVLSEKGTSMAYNKADLRNPPVIAIGDVALDWRSLLSKRLSPKV